MGLDLYFFNLINGFASKWKWLDFFAIFFSRYLAYFLFLALLAVAFIFNNVNIFLFPVLCGLFSRFIANEIIYFFYKRKRPPEIFDIKSLIEMPSHSSFPSGHASFFFALSFALLYFSVPWGTVFCALSLLVGFFRVFVGIHWISDILAGAVMGGISSLLTYPLFLWTLSNL